VFALSSRAEKCADSYTDLRCHAHDRCHELFIDVDNSLVFDCISLRMSGIENTPILGRESDGVHERLKDEVTIL